MKLSVLIPCYNEVTRSRRSWTVCAMSRSGCACATAAMLAGGEGTVEIVVEQGDHRRGRRLAGRHARSCCRSSTRCRTSTSSTTRENLGKGAAVRTAIEHATGDIMLVQDADLEYDPRDYPALLQPILENTHEGGLRQPLPGRAAQGDVLQPHAGQQAADPLHQRLFDTILSDMETCYKVFTREVAEQLHLKSTGAGASTRRSPPRSSSAATASTRCRSPTTGASTTRARRSVGATV